MVGRQALSKCPAESFLLLGDFWAKQLQIILVQIYVVKFMAIFNIEQLKRDYFGLLLFFQKEYQRNPWQLNADVSQVKLKLDWRG